MEPRGTSSPRISLPEGSSSRPTLLLHVDQELGCNNLLRDKLLNLEEKMPVQGESNTSTVETLPEDIPDELGHEWRVLHPFELLE